MSSYRDSRDTPTGTGSPIGDHHLSGHTYVIGVPGSGGRAKSCNGDELSRVVPAKARRTAKATGEWPPPEYALPDDLDSIEHGRRTQQQLFPEQPSDSRAARLARILDAVPGVVLAVDVDRQPGEVTQGR